MKTSERLRKLFEVIPLEMIRDGAAIEKDVAEMEQKLSAIAELLEENERSHGTLEGFSAKIDCALTGEEYCEECSRCKTDCPCEEEEE